jgi:hypothetical protein
MEYVHRKVVSAFLVGLVKSVKVVLFTVLRTRVCTLTLIFKLYKVDIDECKFGIANCDPLVECTNLSPGYKCGTLSRTQFVWSKFLSIFLENSFRTLSTRVLRSSSTRNQLYRYLNFLCISVLYLSFFFSQQVSVKSVIDRCGLVVYYQLCRRNGKNCTNLPDSFRCTNCPPGFLEMPPYNNCVGLLEFCFFSLHNKKIVQRYLFFFLILIFFY